MAGNLEAAINSSAKVIRVSALTPPLSGALLRIEDELLAFRSVKRLDTPPFRPNEDGDWNVDRGVAGTTAASHAEDSEVVYAYPVYGDEPIDQAGGGGTPAGFTFSDAAPLGQVISPDTETKALALVVGDPDADFAYVRIEAEAAGSLPAFDIYAQNADGTVSAEVAFSAGIGNLQISVNGASLQVYGLPTADPLNANEIYTDGAPTADTPKHVMMSGGTAP